MSSCSQHLLGKCCFSYRTVNCTFHLPFDSEYLGAVLKITCLTPPVTLHAFCVQKTMKKLIAHFTHSCPKGRQNQSKEYCQSHQPTYVCKKFSLFFSQYYRQYYLKCRQKRVRNVLHRDIYQCPLRKGKQKTVQLHCSQITI